MDPAPAGLRAPPTYRPSGRVRWLPFAGMTAVVVLASICFADAAFRIDHAGWYPTILGPFAVALALASVAAAATTWSHCRSRPLAAMLGMLAGFAFLAGFLEARLIDAKTRGGGSMRDIPLQELLAGLPEYTVLRIHQVSGVNGAPMRATGALLAWRWFAFGVEATLLLGLPAAAAAAAAGRPYSESRRRWMESTTRRLPRGRGALLLSNLAKEAGSEPAPSADGPMDAVVVVESAPDAPDERAFVSILDRPTPSQGRRWLCRRLAANPGRLEAAMLAVDPAVRSEEAD